MTTTRWWLIGLLAAVPALAGAQAPDGKTLYESNCKMCHGPQGIPPQAMKKAMPGLPTFDSVFRASHPTDSIVKVLIRGGKLMKPFKDKLTPAQMNQVAEYVRALAQKGRTAGTS